jgi:aminodeoxyfutalosine deaminase
MIIRAPVVVTMENPPIENGAVAVSGNRIIDVGTFDEIRTRNGGNALDLEGQLLLPGLINAHCHLDYTSLRGKIPPQKSFTDWIRNINAAKAELAPNDYVGAINRGFAEAKRFGTTAIANLTAFPELMSQIEPPIRTWWFAELIDIRVPERANELLESAIESLDKVRGDVDLNEFEGSARRGLAPHALFTASENLFRRCEQIAQHKNLLLTTHLAESREEMEMFRNASGPLYEFLESIGRPTTDCGSKTPLQVFLDALGDRAQPQWIVVHLNELTEGDFDLLEGLNSKFRVVHCPRSHNYFGHTPFPFDRLRSLGFKVCLGTDSLASNENLSLFDEMRTFQKNFPRVSPKEILRMATVNPARALAHENMLGQIRPGFGADLIAIPCSSSRDVLEQIIAFNDPVTWSMLNGIAK